MTVDQVKLNKALSGSGEFRFKAILIEFMCLMFV